MLYRTVSIIPSNASPGKNNEHNFVKSQVPPREKYNWAEVKFSYEYSYDLRS